MIPTGHPEELYTISNSGFAMLGAPLPGESLDSWIEHLAVGNGGSMREMARLLGMEPTSSSAYFVRDVTADDLVEVSRRTSIPISTLESTVLRRWAHLGLLPAKSKRGHAPGVWTRGAGTRFCPQCLGENGGRWKLRWRLHWSFLCVEHSAVLLGGCAQCNDIPGCCKAWGSIPVAGERGDCTACGRAAWADMRQDRLDPEHPVAAAQMRIDAILDGVLARATVGGARVSLRSWLTDLSVVTKAALVRLHSDPGAIFLREFASHETRSDLESVWARMQAGSSCSASGKLAEGVVQPARMAVACSFAIEILDQDSVEGLGLAVRWLSKEQTKSIRTQAASGQPISSALQVAVSSGYWLSAHARLRRGVVHEDFHEEHSPGSRQFITPDEHPGAIRLVGTELPAGLRDTALIRVAVAIAVLTNDGTEEEFLLGCEQLGYAHVAPDLFRTWEGLLASTEGDALLREILQARLALCSAVGTIHYGRRRHVFAEPEILTKKSVTPVAVELDRSNTAFLRLYCSYFVWELLTSSSIELHPLHMNQFGHVVRTYRRLRQDWLASPPHTLIAVAERRLARHRIDEPLDLTMQRQGDGAWSVATRPRVTRPPADTAMRSFARICGPGQLRLANPTQVADYVFGSSAPLATSLRRAVLRYGAAAQAATPVDSDGRGGAYPGAAAGQDDALLIANQTGRHPDQLVPWPPASSPRPFVDILLDRPSLRWLDPDHLQSANATRPCTTQFGPPELGKASSSLPARFAL